MDSRTRRGGLHDPECARPMLAITPHLLIGEANHARPKCQVGRHQLRRIVFASTMYPCPKGFITTLPLIRTWREPTVTMPR